MIRFLTHRIWDRIWAGGAVLACLVAAIAFTPTVTLATSAVARPGLDTLPHVPVRLPYIVGTDYGGSVQKRLKDIRALKASQRPVQIRGALCMSSCTMLLGLQNTCVMPHTVFGFHGPSRRGQALPTALFDKISVVIARHYPRQLQGWYMRTARHDLRTMHKRSGAELIAMGAARACAPKAEPYAPDRHRRATPEAPKTTPIASASSHAAPGSGTAAAVVVVPVGPVSKVSGKVKDENPVSVVPTRPRVTDAGLTPPRSLRGAAPGPVSTRGIKG